MKKIQVKKSLYVLLGLGIAAWLAPAAGAQNVTYKPYIELGDAGAFGPTDQRVVAWQTDESAPNPAAYKVEFGQSVSYGGSVTPSARVVDNYLSADLALPPIPTASGPHSNYAAVLKNLAYDTTYFYRVTGPGMPAGGFTSFFHTRKQGDHFSFIVQGDEGFFPPVPNSNPSRLADYEARIVHLMYNTQNLSVPGAPQLPHPDIALNTGDNVYTNGAEGSYRDYWFPVWNSDTDSNETGAPFIRSIPFFIVVGNHDTGATGVNVNMLGGDGAGRFSGNTGGGDAMAYFNNYYFPLNGPVGVDQEFTWTGDSVADNGMFFKFQGISYNSPAAIKAYRDSTTVDAGGGSKRQINHMSNYSFDYGNAHYTFIEANPHVFSGQLDGTANYAKAPQAFSAYPSVLREWLINDLDSSSQTWKFVVFHQPAFSSGNATVKNFQMRGVAKFLEDHGVNMVFNGHEHNYQRTFPLRAEAGVASAPIPTGSAAVDVDTSFDGVTQTVPDGVLYLVEGAGGNRDFDNNLAQPRGSAFGVDQDDSATGTFSFGPGLTFVNGPASWLDTHLTDNEMSPVLPGAGSGPKITTKFKAKVFSFADIIVEGNKLNLYQVTEPLQSTSSATASNPAPFGTDVNGTPLNDPIPDTLVDPLTGNVVSVPATGPSALLDKFTMTKPDLGNNQDGNSQGGLTAQLSAPSQGTAGSTITYSVRVRNDSAYGLNGTQVVVNLPDGVTFAGATSDALTVHGSQVVVTLGRLGVGSRQTVQIPATLAAGLAGGTTLKASAVVRSSTALPVSSNPAVTSIGQDGGQDGQN
ncbi:MAG TPA: metallophosphoesterase [Candidatus Acidoferrum sp.]|nr:metallophosphoesterase [Candidatus Acidoferrum sp.]